MTYPALFHSSPGAQAVAVAPTFRQTVQQVLADLFPRERAALPDIGRMVVEESARRQTLLFVQDAMHRFAATTTRQDVLQLSAELAREAAGDPDLISILADQAALALERIEQTQPAALGQVVSGVIHDIKNAMTPIRAAAQLLERKAPEAHQQAETVVAQVDRVVEMSREVLAVARGQQALDPRPVQVDDFLQEVVDSQELPLQQAGIKVQLEVECDEGYFDPVVLQGVLANLMQEASKTMPAGDILSLRARQAEGWLVLEMEDSGDGIPPGEAAGLSAFLFHEGKRSDPSLGISIAQAIAEAHGGFITVHRRGGRGTCITLCLPPFPITPVADGPPRWRRADELPCCA